MIQVLFFHGGKHAPLLERYGIGIHHGSLSGASYVDGTRVDELLEDLGSPWTTNATGSAIYNPDVEHTLTSPNDLAHPAFNKMWEDHPEWEGFVQPPQSGVHEPLDYRVPFLTPRGYGNRRYQNSKGVCGLRAEPTFAIPLEEGVEIYPDLLVVYNGSLYLTVDPIAGSTGNSGVLENHADGMALAIDRLVNGVVAPLGGRELAIIHINTAARIQEQAIKSQEEAASEAFQTYKAAAETLNNLRNASPSEAQLEEQKEKLSTAMSTISDWEFAGDVSMQGDTLVMSSADVKIGRWKTKIDVSYRPDSILVSLTNPKIAPNLDSPVWVSIGNLARGTKHSMEKVPDVLRCLEGLETKDIVCL